MLMMPDVQAHAWPSEWQQVREVFQKGHLREFRECSDVVLACQWKIDIQRHLRMGDCDKVRKQMLTTFSLVGVALQWWESITTVEERDTLAIAEFWVRFDRKYSPPEVETETRRKFCEMTQGDR